MGALARQTWTLHKKNLRIIALRHWFSTFLRCLLFPIIFVSFISFSRNLLKAPSNYGVGTPAPVKDLSSTLAAQNNQKLVFVTNNLGGEVQELVDELAGSLRAAGGNVVILQDPNRELEGECRQSIRGSSDCFAAVVFNGSPGTTGHPWSYMLRGDSSYKIRNIYVDRNDDDLNTWAPPQLE